ncbi:MAG: hypothetical protein M1833_003399 [Piccolia ochrophora]|nr:MAG: hypothetical protein M1833_003399 [Piccolia ochrophora]
MAEIAGLAMGAQPLLISAVEHYDDICRPFKRYYHYNAEVQRFYRNVKAQNFLFRTEALLLLAQITNHAHARQMLDDPTSSAADYTLCLYFARLLGESSEVCVEVMQLIKDHLSETRKEVSKLVQTLDRARKSESAAEQSKFRRMSTIFKFSIGGRYFDKKTATLIECNQQFCAIARQVVRITEYQPSPAGNLLPGKSRDMREFGTIRRTAGLLYRDLTTACALHSEHLAHFSLLPIHSSVEDASMSEIRFTIAFAALKLDNLSSYDPPLWLTVESKIDAESRDHGDNTEDALSNLMKALEYHESLEDDRGPPLPPKKSVKFHLDKDRGTESSSTRDPIDPLLPNLCTQNNFCQHVQICSERPASSTSVCVGFLELSGTAKHFVHLPPPSSTPHVQTSLSLAKLIALVSERHRHDALPNYERVRLARLLSIAVLQLHATDWLRENWHSDDLLFYGINLDQTPSVLPTPYLNVSVKGPHVPRSRVPTSSVRTFAPNPQLYGLGVILLELEYETPLRDLQQPEDVRGEHASVYADFFTAERLSRSTKAPLGLRYYNVVKRCLKCDFGCGDDLGKSALQEAFYRDVVCELEASEQEMRKFNLDVPEA